MRALQVNILLGHSHCTRAGCIKYLIRRPSGKSWTESKFSSPGRVAHSRRISIRMTASGAVAKPGQTFFLDKFAYRQFEGGHVSQLKIEKEDFVNQINSRCKEVSFSPLRHYKTKALLWQLASLKLLHRLSTVKLCLHCLCWHVLNLQRDEKGREVGRCYVKAPDSTNPTKHCEASLGRDSPQSCPVHNSRRLAFPDVRVQLHIFTWLRVLGMANSHAGSWMQADLVDGYAPFCKHLFVPNFVGATLNSLQIDDSNRHLLVSGYSKRRPEELAVLTRHASSLDFPYFGRLRT